MESSERKESTFGSRGVGYEVGIDGYMNRVLFMHTSIETPLKVCRTKNTTTAIQRQGIR